MTLVQLSRLCWEVYRVYCATRGTPILAWDDAELLVQELMIERVDEFLQDPDQRAYTRRDKFIQSIVNSLDTFKIV